MADYIKKKIVEKLARFTRDVKPADLSLSFLRGKGELKNLDLNTDVIASALRLPPWIKIERVFCDSIRIDVPFTDINKSPIRCMLGVVTIDVSTCREWSEKRSGSEDLLGNVGSSNTSYGLTEKIIDGMRIEIRSILVHFKNPVFKAKLEISDVLIESTTHNWEPAVLPLCRYRNEEEGTVVIYKKATWSSLKLEGAGLDQLTDGPVSSQLRVLTSHAEIRVSLKRQLSNCKVLYTRISVSLGDVIWVVTQEQLKALSMLLQSLVEVAVNFAQHERTEQALLRGSRDSLDSIDSISSSGTGGIPEEKKTGKKEKEKERNKRVRKDDKDVQKERLLVARLLEYQMGSTNLPSYEVIQDSFHLKTGNLDLQLCDERGSLLLQVKKLLVDVYLDQTAASGRSHWNKANIRLNENVTWSGDLIRQAEKIQDIHLASIYLYRLRERGVLIRCSDFLIKSISDKGQEDLLPIISSDKETFNLPDDVENPAFQCGLTMYYYPIELGNKFLIPRPNISIYLSPVHVNFHQEQCLWLAEFVHGVARTVNLNLLLSAQVEGQHLLNELKAKREDIKKLPGIDVKFYLPYCKITLPMMENSSDGRPQGLQIETGGIYVENNTLLSLLKNPEFLEAWERASTGWLPTSTGQFPHNETDPTVLPTNLVELINSELKAPKTPPTSSSKKVTSMTNMSGTKGSSHSGRLSTPDINTVHQRISNNQLKLSSLECWYAHTRCVTLSFVADLSHEATLYTQQFIEDFPLHCWIFQPKKIAEILALASPSPSPPPVTSSLPSIYALLDVNQPLNVQLQHLQFLFLMRLKDSFQGFKESLMGFLNLDSFIETQQNEAFQLVEEEGSDNELEDRLKDKLFSVLRNSRPRANSKSQGDFVTAGVTFSGLHISVLLPTLTKVTKKRKLSTNPSTVSLPSSPPRPTVMPIRSQTEPISYSLPTSPSLPKITVSSATPTSSQPLSKTSSLPQLVSSSSLPLNCEESISSSELIHSQDEFILVHHSMVEPLSSSDSPVNIEEGIEEQDKPVEPQSPSNTISVDLDIQAHPLNEQLKPQSPSNTDLEDIVQPHPLDGQIKLQYQPHLHDNQPNLQSVNYEEPIGPLETLKPHLLDLSVKSFSSATSNVVTPEYILYASTGYVRVQAMVSSRGIVLRAAIDSVEIEELKEEEMRERKAAEDKKRKRQKTPPVQYCLPVIKARVELGESVKEYFSHIEPSQQPKGVVFLKVSGLQPSLCIKNAMFIKEFFNDEIESDSPLPLQIRVMETQVFIKDIVGTPFNAPRNITVNIPDLFLNRGPRAQGTNLVFANIGSMASGEDEVESSLSSPDDTNNDLLDSFERFIKAFQSHAERSGIVSVSNPDKVSKLVKELLASISAPPSYVDAMSCDFYSNVSSSSPHSTVDSLQAELECLQKENQELRLDLQASKQEVECRAEDRQEVLQQLVEVQMKYASLQLAHEKQLSQIDKLLTEKTDLQDQLKFMLENK